MKNFFSIISLLIACLPSLAQQGTSMRATNGIGFGISTFNGPIAATNTLTTNQFAGKFRQGNGTRASGTSASAFGVGSVASGQFSFAEGLYTTAGNNAAHAEGSSNSVSGASAHAEGLFNEASGTASHAQGVQNVANGIASHASGRNVELQSGTDYTFGGGLNIIALGAISNSFLWNADWGNTMSPATGSVFMVDAPNGIFFDGSVYVSNGSLVGDGSGLTNLPPSAGVGAISYTVSGGGQAIVNGVYTNGTSTSWLHGGGPTATSLEYHPGESPTWIFYNGATPLYSAESLIGPWTIEVGGLAPAPTVLVGGGNFGVFYGDGANLTNIGANSIKSMWASNVFAGGTLAVGSIVSSGTITGNGYGLTNLPTTALSNFLFATSSHVPGREFVEWSITEQDPATNNTYGFRVIQTETSGENSLTNGHGAGLFEVLIQNGNAENYKERLSGVYGYIHHSGSGGVGDGRGILSVVQNASSGRITNGYGFYSTGQNVSSGQMQNYNDFFAHTFINTGGGPGPSNIYAFRVEGNTAGSNNFGFYSPGGDSNYLAALTTTNINTTTAAISASATVGTTVTFPATATTNTVGLLFGSGASGFSLYRYQSSGYAMDFGSLRMGGDIVFNGNNAFDVGSFSTKARQIIGVNGYLATVGATTVNATNSVVGGWVGTTVPAFKSKGTNNVILTAADGGTWILRVDAAGTLSTVTNTAGL